MSVDKEFTYKYYDAVTQSIGDKIRPPSDRRKPPTCCEVIVQVFQETTDVCKVPVRCASTIQEIREHMGKLLQCDVGKIQFPTHNADHLQIEDIQNEACDGLPSDADDKDRHRNIIFLPCFIRSSADGPDLLDLIPTARTIPRPTQKKEPGTAPELKDLKEQLAKKTAAISKLEKELKESRRTVEAMRKDMKSSHEKMKHMQDTLDSNQLQLHSLTHQLEELVILYQTV